MSLHYDGEHFWFRTGNGGQQQPVPDASRPDLMALVDLFRLRFRRDPRPGDPLIFDPGQDVPTPLPPDDVKAATAAYLEELDVHPAYKAAHAELGFLVTAENARHARQEDIAAWGKAIANWRLANPTAPEIPSLAMGSVKPRVRATPESAAVHEALAHADRAAIEQEKLVVAVLCVRGKRGKGGGFELRALYWPDFVRTVQVAGGTTALRGQRCLQAATPAAFAPYVAQGWIPVAVAFGDAGPDATFVPVVAGMALTRVRQRWVTEEGMKQLVRMIGGL